MSLNYAIYFYYLLYSINNFLLFSYVGLLIINIKGYNKASFIKFFYYLYLLYNTFNSNINIIISYNINNNATLFDCWNKNLLKILATRHIKNLYWFLIDSHIMYINTKCLCNIILRDMIWFVQKSHLIN